MSHGWLNVGWISLSKWQFLQCRKSMMLKMSWQGMTNDVGSTFSVGDTLHLMLGLH